TSQLMKELNFEQTKRKEKTSLARRIITAGPDERFNIRDNLRKARQATEFGIDTLPTNVREDVLSFIDSLGSLAKDAGLSTSDELLNRA
ncbi:hypothetical protein, partial [Streptococcus pneumoniae]|uniref:hypothetical protein n=1 Tax=Streptococcus pneumoniae TaxID=1313 RepID=UPI0018B07256